MISVQVLHFGVWGCQLTAELSLVLANMGEEISTSWSKYIADIYVFMELQVTNSFSSVGTVAAIVALAATLFRP